MAAFRKIAATIKNKIEWLKGKLKRRSAKTAQIEENKRVIGSPTNFQHRVVSLGEDCQGKPMLIDRPRADA